jgi:hypothetical protein
MALCAFCQRPAKMSGEHIWGAWIGQLLKGREFSFRRVGKGGEILSEWEGDKLNSIAKVVCEPCNNQWMSAIDAEAKRTLSGVLLGRPVSFLPEGLNALAKLAFKMAVVCDHSTERPKPFFQPAVREKFKTSGIIPPGVQMWVGAFIEDGKRNGKFNGYYITLRNGKFRGFQYFIFTYGISPLVVQLAACRWSKPSPRKLAFPALRQHQVWNNTSVEFWPPTGRLEWPPKKSLDLSGMDVFISRWTTLVS